MDVRPHPDRENHTSTYRWTQQYGPRATAVQTKGQGSRGRGPGQQETWQKRQQEAEGEWRAAATGVQYREAVRTRDNQAISHRPPYPHKVVQACLINFIMAPHTSSILMTSPLLHHQLIHRALCTRCKIYGRLGWYLTLLHNTQLTRLTTYYLTIIHNSGLIQGTTPLLTPSYITYILNTRHNTIHNDLPQ